MNKEAELRKYAKEHQQDLWYELSEALDRALSHCWSMGCDHALRCLVENIKVTEYVTPRDCVSWEISRSPLYDAIAERGGVAVPLLDPEEKDLWDERLGGESRGDKPWRDFTEFAELLPTRDLS